MQVQAASAELALTSTDSPDPVIVGAQLTYTVTVTNNGPGVATNVTVTDQLSATANLVSVTPSQGTCSGTTTLTCPLGSLPSGGTATVTVVITPTFIGSLVSIASVAASQTDPTPANNSATITTTVVGAPSSFLVVNTNDSGAGSLRQAIVNSNNSAGPDTISFAIGSGVQTITPLSTLPTISEPVTIDATTQPGYNGTPLIELNGNGLAGNGLNVTAGLTTIRGLVINRFGGTGIVLAINNGNVVEGNYIGIDQTGTLARPNGGSGVAVTSANNQIGGGVDGIGNVISGNTGHGILVNGVGANGNVIIGNFIGTNADGTAALPNGFHGIQISSGANTRIGGGPGSGNVISGNAQNGIAIFNAEATNTRVEGNRIGTNGVGTAAIPNVIDGVSVTDAPNTVVGGPGAGARNLLSGNGRLAVAVVRASGTVVQGNLIGTDLSGTLALGNGFGISVNSSANCIVGGTEAGEGNVIRFNAGFGVAVNAESLSTRILGNAISDNAGLGIDLTPLGLTANDTGDADSGANNLQNFPALTAATGAATMTAQAAESDPVPGNNAAAVNTSVIGGPSSFLVTNVNDSGAGSLRQAILNANASSGTDAISFGIPSAEGQTITLASPLPAITDPVSISGATQPGFAGTPIVELNGNGITGSGLTVSAANTTLSGLVINRFNGPGILIIGNNTTNTFVQGNYIGTDLTGTLARPNAVGIQIGNTVTSPTNSLIGGTTAATRNVISGNTGSGVVLPTGNGHAVTGNYIGTSADGAGDLGNGGAGVWIVSATNTTVGATAPGAGNVISGNNQHGVLISGSPATLHGNLIGTNATGDAGVPNGLDGIRIEFASGNTIGGVPGFGNTIAFNTGSGVTIQTGSSNRISGNSIHSNGALGIDLLPAGVTPNDAGDADTGPNNLLNFPVLTAVTGGVQGTLNSTPNGTFRIEFFRNLTCDASGNGEGATFLGTTTVTTDVTGNGTIPLFTAAGGQLVVATATDSSNNTSEFSSCVQTGAAARSDECGTGIRRTGRDARRRADRSQHDVRLRHDHGRLRGWDCGELRHRNQPDLGNREHYRQPHSVHGRAHGDGHDGHRGRHQCLCGDCWTGAVELDQPDLGQQGQTNLNLTVTGQNTHFVQDVTTATLGGGVIVNSGHGQQSDIGDCQPLHRAFRAGRAGGRADDRRRERCVGRRTLSEFFPAHRG